MNTWQQYPENEPDKMWIGDYLPVIIAPLPSEAYLYDIAIALWDPRRSGSEWFDDEYGRVPEQDITDRVVAFIEPPHKLAMKLAKERKEELR